ncbi:MAG: ribosomal-processing cysteine protease Prp [Clostridia bacterium]|nr:ribosomal-processing cysteine protease Prp [Clostridia bacterium]
MITVCFQTNEDSHEISLTARGHAGFAELGEDIVCSAASVLAYTAAQVMDEVAQEMAQALSPNISLLPGNATLSLKCRDERTFEDAKKALRFVEVGYSLLAHNYPQYVRFENAHMGRKEKT